MSDDESATYEWVAALFGRTANGPSKVEPDPALGNVVPREGSNPKARATTTSRPSCATCSTTPPATENTTTKDKP